MAAPSRPQLSVGSDGVMLWPLPGMQTQPLQQLLPPPTAPPAASPSPAQAELEAEAIKLFAVLCALVKSAGHALSLGQLSEALAHKIGASWGARFEPKHGTLLTFLKARAIEGVHVLTRNRYFSLVGQPVPSLADDTAASAAAVAASAAAAPPRVRNERDLVPSAPVMLAPTLLAAAQPIPQPPPLQPSSLAGASGLTPAWERFEEAFGDEAFDPVAAEARRERERRLVAQQQERLAQQQAALQRRALEQQQQREQQQRDEVLARMRDEAEAAEAIRRASRLEQEDSDRRLAHAIAEEEHVRASSFGEHSVPAAATSVTTTTTRYVAAGSPGEAGGSGTALFEAGYRAHEYGGSSTVPRLRMASDALGHYGEFEPSPPRRLEAPPSPQLQPQARGGGGGGGGDSAYGSLSYDGRTRALTARPGASASISAAAEQRELAAYRPHSAISLVGAGAGAGNGATRSTSAARPSSLNDAGALSLARDAALSDDVGLLTWSDFDLLFRPMLVSGFTLTKHGRSGDPKRRRFWLDAQMLRLVWESGRLSDLLTTGERSIDVANIIQVQQGLSTDLLRRKLAKGEVFGGHATRFFSLVLPDRTLDLEASSHAQAQVLVRAFAFLTMARNRRGPGRR